MAAFGRLRMHRVPCVGWSKRVLEGLDRAARPSTSPETLPCELFPAPAPPPLWPHTPASFEAFPWLPSLAADLCILEIQGSLTLTSTSTFSPTQTTKRCYLRSHLRTLQSEQPALFFFFVILVT